MIKIYRYEGCDTTPNMNITARTMPEARRIAARLLGRNTLRGAARWPMMTGTAYGVGSSNEACGAYAVILPLGADA